jgi:hypothetical protein
MRKFDLDEMKNDVIKNIRTDFSKNKTELEITNFKNNLIFIISKIIESLKMCQEQKNYCIQNEHKIRIDERITTYEEILIEFKYYFNFLENFISN